MRKLFFRTLVGLACGCTFQLLGCDSQKIADIVAGNVRTTAVDVSTFVVESLVNQAFGLQ